MIADEVRQLVAAQIGARDLSANWHGLVLDDCLVPPTKIDAIDRSVENGKLVDRIESVWLVLEESPSDEKGYKIVFSEGRGIFGLAGPGFPTDRHPVLCGFYGDFPTTLESM